MGLMMGLTELLPSLPLFFFLDFCDFIPLLAIPKDYIFPLMCIYNYIFLSETISFQRQFLPS